MRNRFLCLCRPSKRGGDLVYNAISTCKRSSTFCITDAGTVPIRSESRCFDALRTCSHMMKERSGSPASSPTAMCQGMPGRSVVVSEHSRTRPAAESLNRSSETTRAGRVPALLVTAGRREIRPLDVAAPRGRIRHTRLPGRRPVCLRSPDAPPRSRPRHPNPRGGAGTLGPIA